eukprot:scaffold23247_cov15-Prasinocladus_malaysianus.AAC.1
MGIYWPGAQLRAVLRWICMRRGWICQEFLVSVNQLRSLDDDAIQALSGHVRDLSQQAGRHGRVVHCTGFG